MKVLLVGGACQGKRAYAESAYAELPLTDKLHLRLRDVLKNGGSGDDLLACFPADRDWVVLCDEIGAGIVPIDSFDTEWREATGRLCCLLAARADIVERISCGIPLRLKG